jgi:hypothetical protein
MRFIALAAFILVAGLAIACGGGGGDSEPTEESLRATLTDYAKAIHDMNATGMFRHVSKDYAEKCPFDDFGGRVLLGIAFLGDDFEDAEFRINSVTVDGDRATASADFYLDDKPLGFDDETIKTTGSGRMASGVWPLQGRSVRDGLALADPSAGPSRRSRDRRHIALASPPRFAP